MSSKLISFHSMVTGTGKSSLIVRAGTELVERNSQDIDRLLQVVIVDTGHDSGRYTR